MASGTRSKVSLSSSLSISDPQDVDESLDHEPRRYNQSDDRTRGSLHKNQNSSISTGDKSSVILRTRCGLLYPVPRTIRSPQIERSIKVVFVL